MSIIRHHRGLVAGSVIAGVALTIGVGGVGYAATGGTFILGKANTAGAVTKLTNSTSTALQLVSKPGTPSLKVSDPALVPSLNADLLDGMSAEQLQEAGTVVRRSAPTHTPSEGPINRQARAYCADGEHAVGGGADLVALTADRLGEYYTFLNISAPINAAGEPTTVAGGQATGWKVEATNTANAMSGQTGRDAELYAYVICAPN